MYYSINKKILLKNIVFLRNISPTEGLSVEETKEQFLFTSYAPVLS